MHVLIVSACEKRALPKTRKILDSYATRVAERTWLTPITLEGLRGLHAELTRVATRQTAVACYRNDGTTRMKLLWTVGSAAAFSAEGVFPLGETRGRPPLTPTWLRSVCQLAKVGGYGHDFGKVTALFLNKLVRSRELRRPLADMVRHEWVSARVQQELHAGKDLEAAWSALVRLPTQASSESILSTGVHDARTAAEYLVLTHHRLPEGGIKGTTPSVPNEQRHVLQQGQPGYLPATDLRKDLRRVDATLETAVPRYQAALDKLERLAPDKSPAFWHAAAIRARAALIYADHAVSARRHATSDVPDQAYANLTDRYGDFNQPLGWHLQAVGDAAADYAYKMATARFPALSAEACDSILTPSGPGRFQWQDQASEALQALRHHSDAPTLVLNLAGTGSGKTRMNAKAACTLGVPGQVRFAAALNLKTLTLQTGEAYRTQLDIGGHELSTVIGDRLALRLFQQGQTNTDSNPEEQDFEATNAAHTLPAWLDERAEKKPALQAILGAPVLVSTVDFLIAAGDPGRQAHHADALLRLMHSDLILDEIDSYDPKALFAVCRLIQIAAMFGRNVICSSATLAAPVANVIYRAFASGIRLRAALEETPDTFHCALIHDQVPPMVLINAERGAAAGFDVGYSGYLKKVMQQLGRHRYRIPVLIRVPERSEAAWLASVCEAVEQMHDNNAWAFADTGKRASFGLVRVANVRTALRVARALSARFPDAQVATYHANELMIQRLLKERMLDHLLSRHHGDAHIEADPDISRRIRSAAGSDIPFIVVATPVEEIGRDHDFDWTVIEPSSAQSIVQTAGRTNRHRLMTVDKPNVALLQYNYRWACNKGTTVFIRPGLEYGDKTSTHPEHDLEMLIDFDSLRTVDAGLRFGDHNFARYDDASLRLQLETPTRVLFDRTVAPSAVYGAGPYDDYPLRDKTLRQSWLVDFDDLGHPIYLRVEPDGTALERNRQVKIVERAPNDWLCRSLEELAQACDELGIPREEGLRVDMPIYSTDKPQQTLQHDLSFGFQWVSE